MRLTPNQIEHAILHPASDVREAAVYYFSQSRRAPLTTLPRAVEAIEKYGWPEAFRVYGFLEFLPQTDATLTWMIRQLSVLREPRTDQERDIIQSLCAALWRAEPDLLRRHQATIFKLFPENSDPGEAITERIWFSEQPPEWLWGELESFCQHQAEEVDIEFSFEQEEFGDRLVLALACHENEMTQQVLRLLSGGPHEYDNATWEWVEMLLVQLAGLLQLTEAVPLLLPHLGHDDLSQNAALDALIRIGTPEVVRALDECLEHGSDETRLAAVDALEHIHTELSVEVMLKHAGRVTDPVLRSRVLESLLLNFVPEAIEPARQYILTTAKCPDVLEVRSALLTICTLLDQRFPELESWAADSLHDQEFRRQWYRDQGWDQDDEDSLDECLYEGQDTLDPDDDEELVFGDELPEMAVTEETEVESVTIVRRGPGIGRNDPCPCGSGKKFKKCCYRKIPDDDNSVAHAMSYSGTPSRPPEYPLGTVAFYGPDDKTATKVVAAVFRREGDEPILERWVGRDVRHNPQTLAKLHSFLSQQGVRSVVMSEANMGCPHEEGLDFPVGEDCPFCPYWRGKQGSGASR